MSSDITFSNTGSTTYTLGPGSYYIVAYQPVD
jgi:hypothetical protein